MQFRKLMPFHFSPFVSRLITMLLAVLTISSCSGSVYAAMRTWKNATGKSSIDAELIESHNDWAILRRSDGLLFAVHHERLSAADRRYLANMANGANGYEPGIEYFVSQPSLAQTEQASQSSLGAQRPANFDPALIVDRMNSLAGWRQQLEERLKVFLRERPGEKGILRTRLEMSLSVTYLELAYWSIDNRSPTAEAPSTLVGWADDLMSEIDEDLLNDADKRVQRILELWRRRVTDRQITQLEKRINELANRTPAAINPTPPDNHVHPNPGAHESSVYSYGCNGGRRLCRPFRR